MKGAACSHLSGRCETAVNGQNHPTSSRILARSVPHRCMPRSKNLLSTVRSVTCMALPSQVDGAATVTAPTRPSKDISVPTNLAPVSDLMTVPGGKGRAVELKAGQYFKITNTHGEQVVDFSGFGLPDVKKEVMSMHHSHDETHRLIPQVGDSMVTNLRRPIFTLLEDTGPGVHDTTVSACDQYLYQQQIGVEAAKEHDSCINNLHTSLTAVGHPLTDDPDNYLPPSPFNLWMAVSLKNEGSQLSWDPPAKGQKPGDYVLFRVEIDCVAVMSACPHDLAPYINGEGGPRDVHYQIYETA
ncbi:TPA: hypothetical protein ACH3X2_002602 [Trebouxia sp. C0005]